MNNFKNSENQEHYYSSKSNNNKKKRLTQDQVRLLEASFNGNNRLDPQLKHQLSNELHIPPRQIAIWYQNKRARWKNQSLEMDYTALHMRLQDTLTQKRQLQKEAQRLRLELQNSQAHISFEQEQVLQAQPPPPPTPPPLSVSNSISSNRDDVGSSSLYDEQVINWMNDRYQALQVEEHHARLMGTTYGSNFS